MVVDWVAPGTDPQSPAMVTLRRLARESAELRAPRLLLVEVANALVMGLRRRRWSGPDADAAYSALRRLPMRLVEDESFLDRAYDLARRYDDHPVYDMLYVAVAEHARTTFITADARLRARLSGFSWVQGPD